MTEQIVSVEAQRKVSESTELATKYEGFSITTPEIYSGAGGELKAVKSKIKELDELRKSLTKPLDESKKRIMEFFSKPLEILQRAESCISSAMLNWQREQERIRQAEINRLNELQRKETERLAKLAEKAIERGDTAKAEEFQGRAAVVQAVVPQVAIKVEKIAGIQNRTNWKYRIVDVNKIPREYMIPNEVLIGQMARTTKGALKIDGIEIYSEESIGGGR
jgi:hypothetical protein